MIKYQGISTLEVLEGADRYNRWIADVIEKRLKDPVLEFGAGTGNISQYFLTRNNLHLSDSDSGLVAHLQKRFAKEKKVTVLRIDVEKKQNKYASYFGSVFGVNVLEHIKDDEGSLRNIHTMLRKNGSLVLLVPAKKLAYTRLDKALGHYRRYEKEELVKKLKNTGYIVEDVFFFNIAGLLTWVVRDKFEGNHIHLKPYQIALFDSIVPVVRRIEALIRPPVGISLIVYARKK